MITPQGFSPITPYIFAADARAYIAFLTAAFSAQEIGRTTAPDGQISNCQLQIATSNFMICQAKTPFPPSSAAFLLYVDDAAATLQTATQAGATAFMPVEDMPYGDRQGGVRDPSGNIWFITQRLTHEPYY